MSFITLAPYRLPKPNPHRRAMKLPAIQYATSLSAHQSSLRRSCSSPLYSSFQRLLSTTSSSQLRDVFPAKETPLIQTTPPAWPHHGYTMEEMKFIAPAHRPPRTLGDHAAWKIVRFARFCMDKATGMDRAQKGDKKHPTTSIAAEKPLTEAQWVISTAQRLFLAC